jgi:hypothetical protein
MTPFFIYENTTHENVKTGHERFKRVKSRKE